MTLAEQARGSGAQQLRAKPGPDHHSALNAQTGTLSLEQAGWTQEEAAQIRAHLGSFAEDWDDPAMDVYDAL